MVITDRLHCMIFSAITSTPCIVIDNYTNKISGVYKWISNYNYLMLINGIQELDMALKTLHTGNDVWDREQLDKYFKNIVSVL